jgi:putative membrane protein
MYRFGRSLAIAAFCFASVSALAVTAAKPTDPQIAHIAYTAGQIDIEAADQALEQYPNWVNRFGIPESAEF